MNNSKRSPVIPGLARNLSVLCLLILLSSCAAHLKNGPSLTHFEGKSYWLKHSLHGGVFYDDDRYQLLSDTSFEKLTHLRSPTGDYIVPPPSNEVVSIGTRVKINQIEWPTEQNLIKRPLLTPRYLPWVYFTVALDRGAVSLNREKLYILLVPEYVDSEKSFEAWISGYISEEDNNLWFLSLSPSEQEAVLRPKGA